MEKTVFEIGKTYAQEYACGDGRYPMECVKKTAQFATFKGLSGKIERFKIRIEKNGTEIVYNAGWITSEATAHFCSCTI